MGKSCQDTLLDAVRELVGTMIFEQKNKGIIVMNFQLKNTEIEDILDEYKELGFDILIIEGPEMKNVRNEENQQVIINSIQSSILSPDSITTTSGGPSPLSDSEIINKDNIVQSVVSAYLNNLSEIIFAATDFLDQVESVEKNWIVVNSIGEEIESPTSKQQQQQQPQQQQHHHLVTAAVRAAKETWERAKNSTSSQKENC